MGKGENTDEETKNDRTAGLAAGAGRNHRGDLRHTGHDAQGALDEQTFAGDAAAATGVEVQFGSDVWAKLGWRHQYTFGSPQTQTTKFQREKYTGEEQESAAAELSMLADSTAIDHPIFPELRQLTERQAARELTESDGKTLALIEEFFTADGVQTLLSLDDRLPKASDANKVTPEPSIDLKMNESAALLSTVRNRCRREGQSWHRLI